MTSHCTLATETMSETIKQKSTPCTVVDLLLLIKDSVIHSEAVFCKDVYSVVVDTCKWSHLPDSNLLVTSPLCCAPLMPCQARKQMRRATLQAGVLQIVVSIILNDGDAILLADRIDFPFPAKGRHYACSVALHNLLQSCSERPMG